MILPTKGIAPDRALITLGAQVLQTLPEPKTVSRVWDELRNINETRVQVTFDWFVLALDFLFLIGAVSLTRGRLERTAGDLGSFGGEP
jgi:hypothetical protein